MLFSRRNLFGAIKALLMSRESVMQLDQGVALLSVTKVDDVPRYKRRCNERIIDHR